MKLFHYTSLEALLGILGEKEICFWGTRYDSMNDPEDFLFAKNIVLPEAKQWCKKNGYLEELEEESIFNPYIVSFSDLEDNLTLWRLYHGEVCIELDGDYIKELCTKDGIQFCRCAYSTKDNLDIEAAMKQIQKEINIWDPKYLDLLNECCVFIKNKNFEIENEYRIFKSDFNSSRAKLCQNLNGVCLEQIRESPCNIKVKGIKNKDIVLYKEFKFPKKILKGLTLHCVNYQSFLKLREHLSLILYFRGYGIKDNDIKMTNTKYNN